MTILPIRYTLTAAATVTAAAHKLQAYLETEAE
jgi:hypothetical protein